MNEKIHIESNIEKLTEELRKLIISAENNLFYGKYSNISFKQRYFEKLNNIINSISH